VTIRTQAVAFSTATSGPSTANVSTSYCGHTNRNETIQIDRMRNVDCNIVSLLLLNEKTGLHFHSKIVTACCHFGVCKN